MGTTKCRFVVSVDAEEDVWGWSSMAPITCANVLELHRLARFFSDLRVRPTFFVTYRVLSDPSARAVIRELAAEDWIEIGCHVHPWNTPPQEGSPRRTILYNYSQEAQASKIEATTRLFEEVLGRRPGSFRAGRFGFGPETAASLIEQGYRVDSSVTPFFDWTESSGGQNYVGAPLGIYRMSPESGVLREDPDGQLLEVPLTSGYTRMGPDAWAAVGRLLDHRAARAVHFGAMGAWLLGFRRAILSPESHGVGDMVALGSRVARSGVQHLHLFFHSSSLLPGLTPFVRSSSDVERLYDRTEAVLDRFGELYDLEFSSATEAAEASVPGRAARPTLQVEPLRARVAASDGGSPLAARAVEARESYGPRGTKARLVFLAHYVYGRLGGYRQYQGVRWSAVNRLVFVCTGNVCRSPYAEHLARTRTLDAVSVGVRTGVDGMADPTAVAVARARGVSMDGHRTTPLEYFKPREGDLFIAMEPFQAALVAEQPWAKCHQITLLGLWAGSAGPVISDPYGGDEVRFNQCFSVIERGVTTIQRRMEVASEAELQRAPPPHDAS